MTEAEALAQATHRHYKGGLYRVLGVAEHTETHEKMVVYKHLWPHAEHLWTRPLSIWTSKTDDDRVRFQPINGYAGP